VPFPPTVSLDPKARHRIAWKKRVAFDLENLENLERR